MKNTGHINKELVMKYINKDQLVSGVIYYYMRERHNCKEEWIILWKGGFTKILNIKINGRKSPKFGRNSFALNSKLREATEDEKNHLLICIQAGKYVDKPEIQSEIY